MKQRGQPGRIEWIWLVSTRKKSKNQRILNLTRMIKMVKDQILSFKHFPQLQIEYNKWLKKYYKVFEVLNVYF